MESDSDVRHQWVYAYIQSYFFSADTGVTSFISEGKTAFTGRRTAAPQASNAATHVALYAAQREYDALGEALRSAAPPQPLGGRKRRAGTAATGEVSTMAPAVDRDAVASFAAAAAKVEACQADVAAALAADLAAKKAARPADHACSLCLQPDASASATSTYSKLSTEYLARALPLVLAVWYSDERPGFNLEAVEALESHRFEHLCSRCNQFLRRERLTEDIIRVRFAGGETAKGGRKSGTHYPVILRSQSPEQAQHGRDSGPDQLTADHHRRDPP